jgi:hypothetical protein
MTSIPLIRTSQGLTSAKTELAHIKPVSIKLILFIFIMIHLFCLGLLTVQPSHPIAHIACDMLTFESPKHPNIDVFLNSRSVYQSNLLKTMIQIN